MKTLKIRHFVICAVLVWSSNDSYAQGGASPLTIQGLQNTSLVSAASRALGGMTLSIKNDASLMFVNPVTLQTLEGIQISIGGLQQFKTEEQEQRWYPLRSYSNFSLLMEGLTIGMQDPDTSKFYIDIIPPYNTVWYVKDNTINAGDSLLRPFDQIKPNWKHDKNFKLPAHIALAVPLSIGDVKISVGIGVTEYANLNYFYQNNNVFSSDLALVQVPSDDSIKNAIPVYWTQNMVQRDGSIYGYGGAFSIALSNKLALGVSAILLRGSSDDIESAVDRGGLLFFKTFFGLYRSSYRTLKRGTSDYNGQIFTLSGAFRGRSVSFGFSIRPPTMIRRDYTSNVQIDSAGILLASVDVSGSDKLKLPWLGMAELSLKLRENVTLDFMYEYKPYSQADYKRNTITTQPWLDCSSIGMGLQYLPTSWLALRVGYHTQQEVFQASGYPIQGQPVTYMVYSGGIGISFAGIQLDLACEYIDYQYEEMWGTNVNINKLNAKNILAQVSYTIQ